MLLLVETSRVGNAWSIASFVTVWGLAMENVAMALALPLWGLFHIRTSTTLLPSTSLTRRQATLLVHPVELDIIPWAVLLGLGTPSIAIFLTDGSTSAPFYRSQQFWTVARLYHPLFTAVIQIVLSMLTPIRSDYKDPQERRRAVIGGLRNVYSVATTVAIIFHTTTLALSISTVLAPSLYAELYRKALRPQMLFQPQMFWGEVEGVSGIAEGARVFLQWDELVSCLSILAWALAVNRQCLRSEPEAASLPSTLFKILLWSIVGGPAAAAVKVIQQRDEVLLDRITESEGRRTEHEPSKGS